MKGCTYPTIKTLFDLLATTHSEHKQQVFLPLNSYSISANPILKTSSIQSNTDLLVYLVKEPTLHSNWQNFTTTPALPAYFLPPRTRPRFDSYIPSAALFICWSVYEHLEMAITVVLGSQWVIFSCSAASKMDTEVHRVTREKGN
jgi:hypothetical protein